MRLTFICAVCNENCPHFKGLIAHYEDKHPELLKYYEIKNKARKTTLWTPTPTIEDALKANGWNIKDCKIKETK